MRNVNVTIYYVQCNNLQRRWLLVRPHLHPFYLPSSTAKMVVAANDGESTQAEAAMVVGRRSGNNAQ
ncbi:hypothetical protein L1987_59405 [Smallanthus sonchifolius]|uniref:Uncharacterized protein n=1 Tax=Smallanthus sonchifolius TaxID=185202 RepID=A0ACB9D5V8_9ASTR|nr:hypothetical protein L1987_59405 [Smallanthus sonchifolius]